MIKISKRDLAKIDFNVAKAQTLTKKHRGCGIVYCEKYDADYCSKHNIWVSQKCPYPKHKLCSYCAKRPLKHRIHKHQAPNLIWYVCGEVKKE